MSEEDQELGRIIPISSRKATLSFNDNPGVATRKMVDAGEAAYYEFTKYTVDSHEPIRDLVVKIYRAMKDAE